MPNQLEQTRFFCNQSDGTKPKTILPSLTKVKKKSFCSYAPVACFPALGTRCMFSRAWHQLHVFPRLALAACFPALECFYLELLERFSNECRKTKTKVITPANHNKNKLPNEPIRTRSKYM